MRIGDREICNGSSHYVIAEIGVNHEGSLSKAKSLIDMVVEGGAYASKFQKYKAKSLGNK